MARSGMEDPDDMEMLFAYHRGLDTAVDRFAVLVKERYEYEYEEEELDRCKTVLKQIIPQFSCAEAELIRSVIATFLTMNVAMHQLDEAGIIGGTTEEAQEALEKLMKKMERHERGPFSSKGGRGQPGSREEAQQRLKKAVDLGNVPNPADEILRRAGMDIN